nr:G protein-coupled receptor [Proales similis]
MMENSSIHSTNSSEAEMSLPVYGVYTWCLIFVSTIIFTFGFLGNLLVIIVVVKNAPMRTITNLFIVNLAIGDLLVILICLPPTMINDITGSWWFGALMCKIMPYTQYISVCVSVMTLTSISYERYYAIVYPLKFQATKFRAKLIICVVWTIAIFINIPLPMVISIQHEEDISYCFPTWSPIYQRLFDSFNLLILYILPMILIFYTYSRVFKVLWRIDKSIMWEQPEADCSRSTNKLDASCVTMASGSAAAKSKMRSQLNARRKAAKMLISVAMLFAICYLPIHVLNILRPNLPRYIGNGIILRQLFSDQIIIVIFHISHLLVYLNSSVNPLIYNLMSDNFRREFRAILFCCGGKKSTNLLQAQLKPVTNTNRRAVTNQIDERSDSHQMKQLLKH